MATSRSDDLPPYAITSHILRRGHLEFIHLTHNNRMEQSQTCKFIYDPLNLKAREIRVIKVLPRINEQDNICCVLEQGNLVDIQKAKGYAALSYTWGDASELRQIFINNQTFQVRQNLYNFLATVSSSGICRDVWLWIDEISIDQNDPSERNHQVNQMALIYRSAARVMIWLGLAFPGSDALLNFMANTEPEEISTEKTYSTRPEYKILVFRAALQHLTALKYWQRLWICQEVLLARKVVIHLGESSITWSCFAGHWEKQPWRKVPFWDGFNSFQDSAQLTEPGWMRISTLITYRHLWHDSTLSEDVDGLDWDSAMDLTRNAVCSEPLDRIYGLNGLISPSQSIQVDYTNSKVHVFFDVARPMQSGFDLLEPESYREFTEMLRLEMDLEDKICEDDLLNLDTEQVLSITLFARQEPDALMANMAVELLSEDVASTSLSNVLAELQPHENGFASSFIPFVIKTSNTFTLTPVSLNGVEGDEDLIARLEEEYWRMKGPWRIFFSLQRISHCDFAMVGSKTCV